VTVGRAGQIAGGVLGAIVLVLVLMQIFLPKIAASMITSKLRRYGRVQSVNVSAWPALELLWGDADSVSVRALSFSASPAQAANLVWEGRGADRIDMTAASAKVGPLALTGVKFTKRADSLAAQALASEAAVAAALPSGVAVGLQGSEAGRVRVRAGGGLFGVSASFDAVAEPQQGRLVVRPLGLFAGFQLTLFSNPHVYVVGVAASALQDGGYLLQMQARLG
jgi:LmeA-like phospholipid-binding